MKRLRKKYGNGIRVFYCGEYGSIVNSHRPHFHAILFGHDFRDKKAWKKNKRGDIVYTSEELELLWQKGFCTLGNVTFQSAAYVARYIMKKVTGPQSEEHYQRIDPETGEIYYKKPEFCHMSKGIGRKWIEKYERDAYSGDFIVIEGKKIPVPRFYDKVLAEKEEITRLGLGVKTSKVKGERKRKAKKHADNNTPARLAVREEVQNARLSRLKRDL